METIDQSVAFLQALLDIQFDALKSSTAHIAKLRSENEVLRKQIEQSPALASELQDRVVLLEELVRRMARGERKKRINLWPTREPSEGESQ